MIFSDRFHKITETLLRAIFPKHCPVCDEIIPLNEEYCKCSRAESTKISNDFCRHCAQERINCTCENENSVYLPEVASVYVYNARVRSDILSLKFNYEKRIAKKLGADMAERVAKVYSNVDFDIVTFVPMSEASLRKRTYNQSQLLADVIGKRLFVDTLPLFSKKTETAAQHTLSGKERIDNLKGAISLDFPEKVEDKTILVCDDVKTTGATLDKCVRLLEDAGAKRVCCICVAVSEFRR